MNPARKRTLHAAGWKIGTAREFLDLTDEEARLVRLRLALTEAVRAVRARSGMSQAELAGLMKSSQSRVAKIEAGDPSVSLDLIVRALFAAGAKDRDVARAFAGSARRSR